MDDWRCPPAWEAAGARFGRDGLLYLNEWRRGFEPAELRALFWECQQVRSLRHENTRLERDLARAEHEKDAAESRATFYRRNLILESKLGAMLARIAA